VKKDEKTQKKLSESLSKVVSIELFFPLPLHIIFILRLHPLSSSSLTDLNNNQKDYLVRANVDLWMADPLQVRLGEQHERVLDWLPQPSSGVRASSFLVFNHPSI